MKGIKLLSCAAFGCGTLTAWGQVSALNNFPIADVMGHREFQINQTFAGSDTKLNTSYVQSTNYLLGLFDIAELSGNADWLGNHQVGLKLTPWRSKDERTSFGFGWQDLRGQAESPFACARHTLGNWNLYGGWQRDEENRVLLGFDHALSDKWILAGEYAGSATGSTSFSVFYNITPGLVFQGIWTKPHDSTVDANHQFVLTYTFRI